MSLHGSHADRSEPGLFCASTASCASRDLPGVIAAPTAIAKPFMKSRRVMPACIPSSLSLNPISPRLADSRIRPRRERLRRVLPGAHGAFHEALRIAQVLPCEKNLAVRVRQQWTNGEPL